MEMMAVRLVVAKKVEKFENDLERQSGVNTSSAKENMAGGGARCQSSHETHSRVRVMGGGGSSAFDEGLSGDDGSMSGGVTQTTTKIWGTYVEGMVEVERSKIESILQHIQYHVHVIFFIKYLFES